MEFQRKFYNNKRRTKKNKITKKKQGDEKNMGEKTLKFQNQNPGKSWKIS